MRQKEPVVRFKIFTNRCCMSDKSRDYLHLDILKDEEICTTITVLMLEGMTTIQKNNTRCNDIFESLKLYLFSF